MNKEKELAETFRLLSEEGKKNALFYVLTLNKAEIALRKELLGQLPLYADRNPAPMGEAANG